MCVLEFLQISLCTLLFENFGICFNIALRRIAAISLLSDLATATRPLDTAALPPIGGI